MSYLEGTKISLRISKEVKKEVGKRVRYLRSQDIDRSGRGYIFPKEGVIQEVHGKNIMISGEWLAFSQVAEMVYSTLTQ